MGRLEGKVAIITGAARGMGSAHARRFVEEGASVIVTDVRADEGRATVAALGENALFLEHDVTDPARWDVVVAEAEKRFGPVTVLVNNAGAAGDGTIETTTVEAYRKSVELLQFSVFFGMKSVLPSMKRAGGGSIINISSTAGWTGTYGVFPYAAAKFAVRGMSKAAALELAPKIRVNTVYPGSVRTPLLLEWMGASPDLAEKMLAGRIPLGRAGELHEVSGIVAFLASEDASYCTGGDYIVDGGLTAQ